MRKFSILYSFTGRGGKGTSDYTEGQQQISFNGYNQACLDWEKYHKWYVNQILCDMQECPAKELHKKRIGGLK